MKPDFMNRITKIIAEIRTRTYIDNFDAEFIKEILQDELIEYHNEVFTYGHSIGYDDGYTLGYDEGYALGYSDGTNADFNRSTL